MLDIMARGHANAADGALVEDWAPTQSSGVPGVEQRGLSARLSISASRIAAELGVFFMPAKIRFITASRLCAGGA